MNSAITRRNPVKTATGAALAAALPAQERKIERGASQPSADPSASCQQHTMPGYTIQVLEIEIQ